MRIGKRTRLKQILLAQFWELKGSFVAAGVCTLGVTIADLLRPWPLKLIFDYVLFEKPRPDYLFFLKESDKTETVVVVSLLIILIAVSKSLFDYSQFLITSRISSKMVHTLRSELFSHLQRLSISFHKKQRSGEVITKINGDTNALRDLFTVLLLGFISESLLLIGMLAIMLALNWKLSLIVLATFPILVLLALYRSRGIKGSARRLRKQEGKIASRLSEVFSSASVVQAFGREGYEEERFRTQSAENLQESVRTARMEAAASRAADIVSAFGVWAVVLWGALLTLDGKMSPGNLVIFAFYVKRLYAPIRTLSRLSARFAKATVSAERVSEILEAEPEIADKPDAIRAENLEGEIVFENVSFNYGDDKDVLRDITFTIAPGEHVALVGPSGSGKSTLASLILRFYDPQQGCITVDGIDLRDYQRDSLRRQIAIVLQESILFATTIKENIAYGKFEATMEEIEAAAKAANAHDFIMDLDDAYDTIIGERGDTLSGGQRQRIAIARTFIRNVPILILDEPMSGLDVESEAAVREALKRLIAGKTCVLITHDLQSVIDADFILILRDGRIVERGKHSELLARSQRYRELHQLKFKQTVREISVKAQR